MYTERFLEEDPLPPPLPMLPPEPDIDGPDAAAMAVSVFRPKRRLLR